MADEGSRSGGDVSRRSFLKVGLAAAAAGASERLLAGAPEPAAATAAPGAGASGKLNVIQIILHDAGQQFGCYGRAVKTPGIDALAAGGAVFSNHFCNSTPCSPARGVVMTGQYAHRNGLIGLVNKGWDIPDGKKVLVDHFNEGGYETVICGLQHERHPRKRNPMHYQKRFSTRGHKDPEKRQISAERVAAAAQKYLEARKPDDKPFYLNLGIFETHAPWTRKCYRPYIPDAASVKLPAILPDVKVVRDAYAKFMGALTFTDKVLGEFFDYLAASGWEKNTLVIFTADHGISFRRAKSSVYEAGMETAMVMRLPGVIKPGTVRKELVAHVDLMPTVLEACGLPIPDDGDGRSYWPVLTGKAYTPNKYVFSERNFHENFDPMRAVRDERYKYIRNFCKRPDTPSVKEYEQMTFENPGQVWRASADRPKPLEELYDLASDPHETVNLAGRDELAAVKKRLRDELFRWMNETGDFLRGADQDEQIMDMDRELKWL